MIDSIESNSVIFQRTDLFDMEDELRGIFINVNPIA
jgi:hypothetical protein